MIMHKEDSGPALGTRYIGAAQRRRIKDLVTIKTNFFWEANM